MTIARLPTEITSGQYRPEDLAETQAGNETLIKLPSFPNAHRALLDQYVTAFRRVIEHAGEIMANPTPQDPQQ